MNGRDTDAPGSIVVWELTSLLQQAGSATEARRQRLEWILLYNRLKAQPGGGAANAEAMAICEQTIAIIDDALATVTTH